MRKFFITLSAIAPLTILPAMAGDAAFTFVSTVNAAATDKLVAAVTTICDPAQSIVKLSPAAVAACTLHAMPRLSTDGTSFRNVGLGTEFNTLVRQLPPS